MPTITKLMDDAAFLGALISEMRAIGVGPDHMLMEGRRDDLIVEEVSKQLNYLLNFRSYNDFFNDIMDAITKTYAFISMISSAGEDTSDALFVQANRIAISRGLSDKQRKKLMKDAERIGNLLDHLHMSIQSYYEEEKKEVKKKDEVEGYQ